MPAPRKKAPEEDKEEWLATYADAITLLMAFFVMMLTFAEFDIPAYEEAAAAIKNKVGNKEETSPTEDLKIEVEDVVFQAQADQVVQVRKDRKGVVIDLASSAFFKPGSAELREAAIPVLENIVKIINAPRFREYNIQIEGHTDDEPISTELFPSNWELAGRRGNAVVRFLEANGTERIKLSSVSFADTKPKVPNRDADGNPIVVNQATNRRTAIRVNPMSLKERENYAIYKEVQRMRAERARSIAAEQQAIQQGVPPSEQAPDAAQPQPTN